MPTISRIQTSQAAVAQPTSTHDGYAIPEGNTVPPGFQNPHLPDTVPGSLGLYVAGTAGDDQLFGSDYADSIFGFAGNNSLRAGAGNDFLSGGDGDDFIDDGEGDDTVDGGNGNDFFLNGQGVDTFFGGSGSDTLSFASFMRRGGGITVDLTAGFSTTGDTFTSIENLIGSSLSDVLDGDAVANRLDGGDGDDWLLGQAGNDTLLGGLGADNLEGGDGNDVIQGGAGADRLTGGLGEDKFIVTPGSDGSIDVFTDVLLGTDKIFLSGFEGNPFGSDGILAVGVLRGDGGFPHFSNDDPATDRVVFDIFTQTLYEVGPVIIAGGHVQDMNEVALAKIIFEPGGTGGFADSFFVM